MKLTKEEKLEQAKLEKQAKEQRLIAFRETLPAVLFNFMARAKKMDAEEGIYINAQMYHEVNEGTGVSFSHKTNNYENTVDIRLDSAEEWEIEQVEDFFIQARNDHERQIREEMEARLKAERRLALLAKMSKEDRELLGV